MKILMISRSAYEWDVRVRREARALSSAGHQVTFMGLQSSTDSDGTIDLIDITSPGGDYGSSRSRSKSFYRAARWFLLPEHRARVAQQFARLVVESEKQLDLRPDVVHAHDFPALIPGAEIATRQHSKLVYDSHEIWSGRPRRGRPEPLRRRRQLRLEAALARTADAVIMVSDQGARLLSDMLGIEDVRVVRNTFPTKHYESPGEPSGAVYAGRIAPSRDLHTVFSATCWEELGLALHAMGEVDDIDLPDWVVKHPMGTMEEVDGLLASVGIGLVTMTSHYINHRIALPNKLCQAISVGIPVVATNAPQTAEIVTSHGLGAIYEAGDRDSFSRAISDVVDDYTTYTDNVRSSQRLFDWQVDASRLLELYTELESST